MNEEYYIIQNSKIKGEPPLLLADRRISNEYWWTYNKFKALKCNLELAQKVLNKLGYNRVRAVKCSDYN